ncbi:zinc finger protein DZIP1L-like [Cyprinus carpio]|uniref:Zinc finger protein DZIP1L-like n=2 Tax=Cyprinus carpio TaxID=7962 RepID=A0A9Q9Y5R9_CYPCA|nr:zinc finger protein DZIP1L-like [Cyprinus carpio]XP_042614150.1 zinc finger protein DZIP1L-like [Cyprinus carpio]
MLGQFSPGDPYSALSTTAPWDPAHLLQPFRFRSRTEPLDWRRLSTLDVERVERDMDVDVLQNFITTVTFCAVEGERCPNCRGPADPSLIKLLRMSQLSTEYLLHCQDMLSSQLSGLEQRLQAALSLVQRGEEQRTELEKNLQEAKQESRRRKKLIATQQLLLQASANNYHKCQFCEKSFVNYSYLQAHVQRRHPEVTDAEKQKKKKIEEMEDRIEELKEKLKLTQMQLQAEKETESLRNQQEQEEQRRRDQSEKEALERWKEEERRKSQQEIGELRQLFLQESKDMASKSSSIEAKLLVLQNKDMGVVNNVSLQEESDPEKELRENRERELKEKMARKKSEWKKRFQEAQNRHRQEKAELKSENARLVKALSVEKNSGSSLQKLQQQVVSLSSQLSQKHRLLKSQEEKIKKLSVMSVSAPVVLQKAQDSPEEPEEEDEESMEDSEEPQWKVLKSHKEKSELMKESRPILEESLEEKLENMGLWKGTKGISKQTFKSLSALLTGQRLQRYRQRTDLQIQRHNLAREVIRRVKSLQKGQGKLTPSTLKQRGKKNSTPVKEKIFRSREGSKSSTWRAKSQQPQALVPTPTPRSNAPQSQTPKTQQKKNGTPPFSSDEDESVEDSAYITSSRGKPSPSVRLVQSGSLLNPTAEHDWTDSELSEASDTPKLHKSPNFHGSVVQTLTRSLERQLSTPVKKPVGGTRVLPPSSSSPRPVIVKQRVLSDEESDLELSSIEELTANRAGVHKSSEVGGTSGTSARSSAASRLGVW